MRFPYSAQLRRLEEYTNSSSLRRSIYKRPDGAWVCELVLGVAMMSGVGYSTMEEAEESAAKLMVDYLNCMTPQEQLLLLNPTLFCRPEEDAAICLVK